MKTVSFNLLVIIIYLFSLIGSYAAAEEKANFKDEGVAKQILLDKQWLCGVGDNSGWGGKTVWLFDEVNGNKVSGVVKVPYCGGHTSGTSSEYTDAPLKGKIKKDTMKFTVKVNAGTCTNFSGKLKFYREDGEAGYRADGTYNRTLNGTPFKGTVFCYVE